MVNSIAFYCLAIILIFGLGFITGCSKEENSVSISNNSAGNNTTSKETGTIVGRFSDGNYGNWVNIDGIKTGFAYADSSGRFSMYNMESGTYTMCVHFYGCCNSFIKVTVTVGNVIL